MLGSGISGTCHVTDVLLQVSGTKRSRHQPVPTIPSRPPDGRVVMLTLQRDTLIEAMIMWIKKPLLQCPAIKMIERENHGKLQTC